MCVIFIKYCPLWLPLITLRLTSEISFLWKKKKKKKKCQQSYFLLPDQGFLSQLKHRETQGELRSISASVCFVKADRIIHRHLRSTCCSLQNCLSPKLARSYNFWTVFKMFQLVRPFFCFIWKQLQPGCSPTNVHCVRIKFFCILLYVQIWIIYIYKNIICCKRFSPPFSSQLAKIYFLDGTYKAPTIISISTKNPFRAKCIKAHEWSIFLLKSLNSRHLLS